MADLPIAPAHNERINYGEKCGIEEHKPVASWTKTTSLAVEAPKPLNRRFSKQTRQYSTARHRMVAYTRASMKTALIPSLRPMLVCNDQISKPGQRYQQEQRKLELHTEGSGTTRTKTSRMKSLMAYASSKAKVLPQYCTYGISPPQAAAG